jgi:transposase
MRRVRLSPQSPEHIAALEKVYRTSKDARLRQRAQIILLATEQGMVAAKIGAIVRLNEESVRKWLKRYEAEGLEGLKDDPRPGIEPTVTHEYHVKRVATVRRRPRSLGQPFSMWTLQRLADDMVQETGRR